MLTPNALISEKYEKKNEQRKLVNGRPITAVVVEHETLSRGVLAALLSCDGYRVFQADNPTMAISHFRTNDPDVLFVDLDMPQWRAIVQHALNRKANIFVVGMVENNSMPDVFNLKQCGIGVCLQKPVLYNDLGRTLDEYFHGQYAA